MGVIKKYKIIYERSIIISNLIFKANRERKKKVLYLLNSSSRKLFSKSHASHQSLGKEILNLLKKKKKKSQQQRLLQVTLLAACWPAL